MKFFRKILLPLALLSALLLSGCAALGEPSFSSQTTASPRELRVHFIDVGQGDSIFIELPNGQTMLIDAGEADMADTVVTYIHQQGADSLDYVVETHPHSDHMGGMAEVIDNFNVSTVCLSPATNNTKAYEKLLAAVESSGAEVLSPLAGDSILSEGELSVEVVAPKSAECDSLNNASLVLKLTYGKTSFLFAGDAEKAEEDAIRSNIKCDVLKVGHHGSSSSTSANFLKKVDPTYAVISVGLGNSYGHPSDAVLKRLAAKGVEVFRTDLQGTIVITSDGASISADKSPSGSAAATTAETTAAYKYVLNKGTMKIHYASCPSVADIKEENKVYTDDYAKAIADGYTPCGSCRPTE